MQCMRPLAAPVSSEGPKRCRVVGGTLGMAQSPPRGLWP